MADINSMFPSKYLKASDLDGPVIATIVGVEQQEMNDGQSKPVIVFSEPHLKMMVVNRTNANNAAKALGTGDINAWTGRKIVIYPSTTEFKGATVSCLRIRDKAPAARPGGAQPAAQQRRIDHQAPLDNAAYDDMPASVDPNWEQIPF